MSRWVVISHCRFRDGSKARRPRLVDLPASGHTLNTYATENISFCDNGTSVIALPGHLSGGISSTTAEAEEFS